MSEAIKAAVELIEFHVRGVISSGYQNPKLEAALMALRPVAAGKSVIVPVEPTEAMMTIGNEARNEEKSVGYIYRAMISAA